MSGLIDREASYPLLTIIRNFFLPFEMRLLVLAAFAIVVAAQPRQKPQCAALLRTDVSIDLASPLLASALNDVSAVLNASFAQLSGNGGTCMIARFYRGAVQRTWR